MNEITSEKPSIFISGAQGGVARAIIAKLEPSLYSCLVLHVRKEDTAFSEWISQIASRKGINVITLVANFEDFNDTTKLVQDLGKLKLKYAAVVLTAGYASGALFEMTSPRELRKSFEVNYFSAIQLIQFFTKSLRATGGRIAYISSVAAYDPFAGYTAYGSSKRAFDFSMEILRHELAQTQVHILGLVCGPINTKMLHLMDPKTLEQLLEKSPNKRASEPEEVADRILEFCSARRDTNDRWMIRFEGGVECET